jgi:D-alanyl-D-alanine carboxypeptidase/D-alanyl-D-alanine-endopeptidase (penicillin-binding protein 4)
MVAAGPGSKKTSTASPKLTDRLTQWLASPALKGADVGLHIVQLDDAQTLFARDPNRLLVPASNTKLFTTAAALVALGPEFHFETLVGVDGDDLVVVGGGDPAIGGRFTGGDPTVYFRRWAKVLRDQGVNYIAGDLVLDDSRFDRQWIHPHWAKGDRGHWYAAPISALSLNDNCIDVRVAPGAKLGGPAAVTLTPDVPFLKVTNLTRTVSSSKQHAPRVLHRPGSGAIECDGAVYHHAAATKTSVPVDDPTHLFATVLREVLADEGVRIVGQARRSPHAVDSKSFRTRVSHRFPMIEAVAVANKESQNLFAEHLLKTIGAERGAGTWDAGRGAAVQTLTRLGVAADSFVLDDGSGLSRQNRATARSFTTLLAAMHRGPHATVFRQSLATSGVDGTLKKRLAEPPYRGRIFAKTGSITGVRSISGYAHTRSGKWLAFSLIINRPRQSVRSLQDELCRILVDQ